MREENERREENVCVTVRLKQVNERFQFVVDELNIWKNEILFLILKIPFEEEDFCFLNE